MPAVDRYAQQLSSFFEVQQFKMVALKTVVSLLFIGSATALPAVTEKSKYSNDGEVLDQSLDKRAVRMYYLIRML